MDTLVPGNVVRIKGVVTKMTISAMIGSYHCEVIWFEGDKKETAILRKDILEKVNSELP